MTDKEKAIVKFMDGFDKLARDFSDSRSSYNMMKYSMGINTLLETIYDKAYTEGFETACNIKPETDK